MSALRLNTNTARSLRALTFFCFYVFHFYLVIQRNSLRLLQFCFSSLCHCYVCTVFLLMLSTILFSNILEENFKRVNVYYINNVHCIPTFKNFLLSPFPTIFPLYVCLSIQLQFLSLSCTFIELNSMLGVTAVLDRYG